MKVRDYYIKKAEALPNAGTFTADLKGGLKIQDIRVKLSATNGATSNTVGKLCGMVSKIEVVDGSDVQHSTSMQELQALNFWQNKRFPYRYLTAAAGGSVLEEAIVCFGRFLGDRDFYLDTSRYTNPQLKITYALTIDAGAGFATGTGALSLLARVIEDGAPPYRGFMMQKEVKSFATVSSGECSTLLDLHLPYQGLMVSALKTTVEPQTILTNFKLQRDASRFVDFDLTSVDLLSRNLETHGWAKETFRPLKDTSATFLASVYAKVGGGPRLADGTAKALVTAASGESVTIAMTTGGAAGGIEVFINGACPHASFWMPFGDGQTPEDWLNPAGLSELELILTQGVAGAAASIVTSQLRQ